jgi:hypothetical protein
MTITPRRITKRFPHLLYLIGLLFLLGGGATWFLMPPPKITARTQLHISVEPPNPLFPENNRVSTEVFQRNQAFLIRDRFVLTAALREPGISDLTTIKEQSDPVQWLQREIKVEFPSPELMHIILSGDRSDEIQLIVSAVTKSYLDNVVDMEGKARRDELDKVKRIEGDFKERARENRKRIRALMEKGANPIDAKRELWQNMPARATLTDSEKKDGKPKAVLSTPNETTWKVITRGAMTLSGLGMLLLILAAFQYQFTD